MQRGFKFVHRFMIAVCLVLSSFALVSCGDTEPKERKAFIEFLEKQVLSRQSLSVPKLTAKGKSEMGQYAAHYQVILDFHDDMNRGMEEHEKVISLFNKLRTPGGIKENWKSASEAYPVLKQIADTMDQALEKAQKARVDLKQPDDLKAVYDKAFEKIVTTPVERVRQISPEIEKAFSFVEEVGKYMEAHQDKLEISGSRLSSSDSKVRDEINELIRKLNEQGNVLTRSTRDFNKYLRGG